METVLYPSQRGSTRDEIKFSRRSVHISQTDAAPSMRFNLTAKAHWYDYNNLWLPDSDLVNCLWWVYWFLRRSGVHAVVQGFTRCGGSNLHLIEIKRSGRDPLSAQYHQHDFLSIPYIRLFVIHKSRSHTSEYWILLHITPHAHHSLNSSARVGQ